MLFLFFLSFFYWFIERFLEPAAAGFGVACASLAGLVETTAEGFGASFFGECDSFLSFVLSFFYNSPGLDEVYLIVFFFAWSLTGKLRTLATKFKGLWTGSFFYESPAAVYFENS